MRAGLYLATLLSWLPVFALAQGVIKTPRSNEESKLRQFFAEDWKYWMMEYPEMATRVGFPGQNRRWTDYSASAIAKRESHLRSSLQTLKAIPLSGLPVAERVNYDLYLRILENAIEGLRYGNDAMPFAEVAPRNLLAPVNQLEGVQQDISRVIAVMPAENLADYEAIVARLEGVPALVDQTIALMQEGLKRGVTPPTITLRDVPAQVDKQIVPDAMASPLLHAFAHYPAAVPEPDRERLRQRAAAAYTGKVVPAFRKLREFLLETYIPRCRETIAVSNLPDPAQAYAFLVRWQTTTDLTPQQIHQIGLAEVKRIRAEMDKVMGVTGFRGTLPEFVKFLRTDPRFYFSDADSLLIAYRDIAKRADPQLAHLFGKLPRLPYGVIPVPAHSAPSQTTGYYQPGSPVAGRPGYFFANTYNLAARPKYEMEALAMHEAVPGHHLQIALAQELEGLPEFRKHIGYSAFVEGWGLYAESLGGEMGFYTDPYSKYGQLTYEMWRAVRLVVDTGMHAMGWSRDRAIQFFLENAGKTEHDIIVEVDRYIVWPGQALAYKIGELKIKELRAHATRELGSRFNIRAFHDEVLRQGAVPLGLLESRLEAWVARENTGHARSRP